MNIFSLYRLEDGLDILGKDRLVAYSKMKYGAKNEIKSFAKEMHCLYSNNKTLNQPKHLVTSTFLRNIPSSSHLIASEFCKIANQHEFENNNNHDYRYIEFQQNVQSIGSQDYSKLTKEERRKAQNSIDLLYYLKNGDYNLLVINDSYISGSQHNAQLKLLTEFINPENITFIYIIKNDNSHYKYNLESQLNNYLFDSNKDLFKFIAKEYRNDNLLYNKRLIMKMLHIPEPELGMFLEKIPQKIKIDLYQLMLLEGLHADPILKPKVKTFSYAI